MNNSNLYYIFNQFNESTIAEIKEFGSGLINKTYQVQTFNAGNFLLQSFNVSIFKNPTAVARNFELISNHLEAKNSKFPPMPYFKTQSGDYYHSNELGEYWRVLPFFQDTFSIDIVENTQQATLAANAFGQFFKALSDIDASQLEATIPNFHNGLMRWAAFEQAVHEDTQNRVGEVQELIHDIYQERAIFSYIAGLDLPLRVTHNDTKINNILFDKYSNEVCAIVDWDTIMPGTILSDFGDMVRTYTSRCAEDFEGDVELQQPYFEAICQGFLGACASDLLPIEKENLLAGAQHIILMQTIRFLTDYLQGDVYYHTNHPLQNLHRSRNQWRLFQSLIKQCVDLQNTINSYL